MGQQIDSIEVFQALKLVSDGELGEFNVEIVSAMEKIFVHCILIVDNLLRDIACMEPPALWNPAIKSENDAFGSRSVGTNHPIFSSHCLRCLAEPSKCARRRRWVSKLCTICYIFMEMVGTLGKRYVAVFSSNSLFAWRSLLFFI